MREDARKPACLKMIRYFKLDTGAKAGLAAELDQLMEEPSRLARYLPALTESQQRALFEVLTGAGMDYTDSTGDPLIVVWNNRGDDKIHHLFALSRLNHWWHYPDRFPWSSAEAPRFLAYRPKKDFSEKDPWVVQLNYYGVHTVKYGEK